MVRVEEIEIARKRVEREVGKESKVRDQQHIKFIKMLVNNGTTINVTPH